MIRSAKALLIAVSLGCLLFGQAPVETPKPDNKAGAYYNFAMGRVYAELAQAYGNKPDMLIDERRQHILELIQKQGRVLVGELSQELKISQITIRKDLDYL